MSNNKTIPDNVVSLRDNISEPPYNDSDIVSFIKILNYIQTLSTNLEVKIILDPTFTTIELNTDGNREPTIGEDDRLWNMSEDVAKIVTLFSTYDEDCSCGELIGVEDFKEIINRLLN